MNIQLELIKEICEQENILLSLHSKGYILRMEKGAKVQHVYGAYWGINNAAADRIACDKCACYALLKNSGIPAVEHELLTNPVIRAGWSNSTWIQALDYYNANNHKVVIKPNQGSSGKDVFYCETISAVEAATQTIFTTNPDAAISPFHKIKTEYRIFYVNGTCPYVYGKRPADSWKHNLSEGATAFELDDNKAATPLPEGSVIEKTRLAQLKNLASRAATAIGINFASIDIIELESNLESSEEFLIMEINSGVQARRLLEQLPHLRDTIKDIFATAIKSMF